MNVFEQARVAMGWWRPVALRNAQPIAVTGCGNIEQARIIVCWLISRHANN